MSKDDLPSTMTKEEKDLYDEHNLLVIPKWLKELSDKDDPKPAVTPPTEKWVMPSFPLSPKQLKKKRHKELMSFLASLVDTGLKKKPLIAKMREQFPKLSSAQICRFVNNQLKLKVIAIDTKYKTKPVIIKGKYWRVL